MTILLIVFVVSGATFVALSIPLIQGRVGPNPWYGFRVRRTLEDPGAWYPVNSYSGWRLLNVGGAEIVAAAGLYWVPNIQVALYASIVGAVVIAGLILGLVQTIRYMHQLSKPNETGPS